MWVLGACGRARSMLDMWWSVTAGKESYWGTRAGEDVRPRRLREGKVHAGYAVVQGNCKKRKASGGLEQGRMWVPGVCWRSRSMLGVWWRVTAREEASGGLEQGSMWVPGACWRSRSMLDMSSSRASAAAAAHLFRP